MEIPITEMSIERLGSYHACLDAVARERRYLALLQAPPLDKSRDWVKHVLSQGYPYFIALQGERVIGWCDISPIDREGFRHAGHLGMGLLAEFRGRGIGFRLMARCLEKARSIGLERIELEVYSSNEPAVRLYQKHGFELEGTKIKARKLDGKYEDIHLMALLF